jgi:hypothetical protein
VLLWAVLELAAKATVTAPLTLLLLVACTRDSMPITQLGLCNQAMLTPCSSSSSCSKCHHLLPLQPRTHHLMQLRQQQQQTRLLSPTKCSSQQQELLACTCCSSVHRHPMRLQ